MSRVSHLLTDTVTYADISTIGRDGPSYGSQVEVSARVEFGTFRVLSANGEERDAVARVMTDTEIPAKARLWLPGDDTDEDNDARVIMRRKKATDPAGGLTLYEVYL